jgi:uncharacterized DUF497 family protein
VRLTFEWHEQKAAENVRKHRVSFEEAKTVFNDPFLVTFVDRDHSATESRYVSVGSSSEGRVLIVIHTERGKNVRLISCRRATPSERRVYEERSA